MPITTLQQRSATPRDGDVRYALAVGNLPGSAAEHSAISTDPLLPRLRPGGNDNPDSAGCAEPPGPLLRQPQLRFADRSIRQKVLLFGKRFQSHSKDAVVHEWHVTIARRCVPSPV